MIVRRGLPAPAAAAGCRSCWPRAWSPRCSPAWAPFPEGLAESVGGFRGIWLHVAAALALVPLVVWHVVSGVRPMPAGWTCPGAVCCGRGAPGGRRRPLPRHQAWPSALVLLPGAAGAYRLLCGGLVRPCRDADHELDRRRGARGRPRPPGAWSSPTPTASASSRSKSSPSSTQCGEGDPRLHQRLVRPPGLGGRWPVASGTVAARSLHVHSRTGYWIRFPIADLDRLLLVTRVGGARSRSGTASRPAWSLPAAAASGGSSGSTASSCSRPPGGGSRRSRSPRRPPAARAAPGAAAAGGRRERT